MKSALTARLIELLHRVFNLDPIPQEALRIQHANGLVWTVGDGTLTTIAYPDQAHASNLTIDLSAHSVSSLASLIASTSGYTVSYQSSELGSRSALILVNGTGNQINSNGARLYAYTSLLWSYMSSLSSELGDAEDAIAESIRQMVVGTASGYWLDELGGYYGVHRRLSESDGVYGPRIIAEVLRPKSNNYAIAAAIRESTGQDVSVTDCGLLPESNLIVGAFHVGDGSRVGISDSTLMYGLFDVLLSYDLLGGRDLNGFIADATEQVNALRSAGTHMRQIGLTGSSLIDDSWASSAYEESVLTISQTWLVGDGTVVGPGVTVGANLIGVESWS